MTVNKDNVRLWVEALRSGKYTQGRTMLENADGRMCCLGVACRVAMDNGIPLGLEIDNGRVFFNDCDAMPPAEVMSWLGIIEHMGNVPVTAPAGHPVVVTELNDVHNWDFNMIADAVEETYLS